MVEINSTTIIDALRKTVANIFTADEVAVIYIDKVPENFKSPSIAILEISLPDTDGIKTEDYEIQNKHYMFDFIYHPKVTTDIYKEFRNIEFKLKTYLRELSIGTNEKIPRINETNAFVQDSIGHFMIEFFVRVIIHDTTSKTKIDDYNDKTKIQQI